MKGSETQTFKTTFMDLRERVVPASAEAWVPLLGQEYPLKEKEQPTPVFLSRISYRQRSLAG